MNSIEAKIFDVELLQLNQHYQNLVPSSEQDTTCNENLQTTQILADLGCVLTSFDVQILQTNQTNAFSLSEKVLRFSPAAMDVANKKALWQVITRYLDEHTST